MGTRVDTLLVRQLPSNTENRTVRMEQLYHVSLRGAGTRFDGEIRAFIDV